MTNNTSVRIFRGRSELVDGIADGFVSLMTSLARQREQIHVVLTGGSVGTDVLAALAAPARRGSLDWASIHFWWGDERWLPAGDDERNDAQAERAFLSQISVPAQNVHRFPVDDGAVSLDGAARTYAAELERFAGPGSSHPEFDLVFLGMGPDAHIASLFPGHEGMKEKNATVIAVRDCPKPPPERLSLTLPTINSAERIWLCLSGTDKAPALGLALAGANVLEVPAAGVSGRQETVFFVDSDATLDVPEDLLAGANPA